MKIYFQTTSVFKINRKMNYLFIKYKLYFHLAITKVVCYEWLIENYHIGTFS